MKKKYKFPIYHSYKEFKSNYDEDFKNWLSVYPDGKEEFFIKTLRDKYFEEIIYFSRENGYYFNSNDDDDICFINYINLITVNEYGLIEDEHTVNFKEFVEILENRVQYVIQNSSPEIENNKQNAQEILNSDKICNELPTDNYCVEYGKLKKYLPFLNVLEFETFDNCWNIEFNQEKYKNFEYSVLQIFEETDSTPSNENPMKSNLQWIGTQTELTELIKALIENGNLKGSQKEIFNSFTDFLNFNIKNHDKLIQDIKNRGNGRETIFLDKLKSSLLDFFTK